MRVLPVGRGGENSNDFTQTFTALLLKVYVSIYGLVYLSNNVLLYRLIFYCCVLNPLGNDEDVELAVKSARTAFESWSTLPG